MNFDKYPILQKFMEHLTKAEFENFSQDFGKFLECTAETHRYCTEARDKGEADLVRAYLKPKGFFGRLQLSQLRFALEDDWALAQKLKWYDVSPYLPPKTHYPDWTSRLAFNGKYDTDVVEAFRILCIDDFFQQRELVGKSVYWGLDIWELLDEIQASPSKCPKLVKDYFESNGNRRILRCIDVLTLVGWDEPANFMLEHMLKLALGKKKIRYLDGNVNTSIYSGPALALEALQKAKTVDKEQDRHRLACLAFMHDFRSRMDNLRNYHENYTMPIFGLGACVYLELDRYWAYEICKIFIQDFHIYGSYHAFFKAVEWDAWMVHGDELGCLPLEEFHPIIVNRYSKHDSHKKRN